MYSVQKILPESTPAKRPGLCFSGAMEKWPLLMGNQKGEWGVTGNMSGIRHGPQSSTEMGRRGHIPEIEGKD